MKRFQGTHLFLAGLLVLFPSAVRSQPSHVEQLRDAAVACLGTTLTDIESFTLDADERAPYLRSQLVAHWINERRQVYESDSLRTERELPAFRYYVDDVQITLRRLGSGRVERKARVALRYTLFGPGKQILADSMCDEQIVEIIFFPDRLSGAYQLCLVELKPLADFIKLFQVGGKKVGAAVQAPVFLFRVDDKLFVMLFAFFYNSYNRMCYTKGT